MKSRLDRIKNWNDLAQATNYNAKLLANRCGVSVRHLERYFSNTFKQTPHDWLHKQRLRRSLELMQDGSIVKETASLLGYKLAEHFSKDFRKTYGISPSQYTAQSLPKFASLQMSHFDR